MEKDLPGSISSNSSFPNLNSFNDNQYRSTRPPDVYGRSGRNGRISTRYSSYAGDGWQETYGQPHEAFFYVELVCNVWFFIELIIRFLVNLIKVFPRHNFKPAGFTSNVGLCHCAIEWVAGEVICSRVCSSVVADESSQHS